MATSKGYGRFLWAQILIGMGILLIVASFLARIVYANQMRDAEDQFVAWIGMSPDIHVILKIVFALLGMCYLLSRHGPFRRPN